MDPKKSDSFSQRRGITPLRKNVQLDGIDDDLKNSLWNAVDEYYLNVLNRWKAVNEHGVLGPLLTEIWDNFLKMPVDAIRFESCNRVIENLKRKYYSSEWNRLYDFIEFLVRNCKPTSFTESKFVERCNNILERESAGYRFIDNTISPITSKEEISEISNAMQSPIPSVNEHLERSLSLLSDRKQPDPRNSIKESISAVESLCQKITGKNTATLGDALNRIGSEKTIEIHPALRDAFNKIYGYTSSAEGIRHAMLEESTLVNEDARFMLVSCSAFINYLLIKSSKAGIKFN